VYHKIITDTCVLLPGLGLQVLNILTGGDSEGKGWFFPRGVNGRINKPDPLNPEVKHAFGVVVGVKVDLPIVFCLPADSAAAAAALVEVEYSCWLCTVFRQPCCRQTVVSATFGVVAGSRGAVGPGQLPLHNCGDS
jgi:hypothetical protein